VTEPPGQPRLVSRRSQTRGWQGRSRSTLGGLQRVVRQKPALGPWKVLLRRGNDLKDALVKEGYVLVEKLQG